MNGDKSTFDKNWKNQPEASYTHWTKSKPSSQIQFAFRNHWEVFKLLMKNRNFNGGKRVLEVGAGRGTLSCYFSDDAYDCTILDSSERAIELAKKIFDENSLEAQFEVGDTLALNFDDNTFDIVFSIGLLEHFDDIESVLSEQVRVLNRNGIIFVYVVPGSEVGVQQEFDWINNILKSYKNDDIEMKEEVYRTNTPSTPYVKTLEKLGVYDVEATGIYPIPMVSHSVNFPFSLMPEEAEKIFVDQCYQWLERRQNNKYIHPWLCDEGYGQAFLVWGYKNENISNNTS